MRLALNLTVHGLLLSAALPAVSESPSVRVRVYNLAAVPDKVLENAQRIASRIFQNADIEVEWAPTTPVCDRRLGDPGDYCPLGRCDLLIRLLPTAAARHAGQKGISGAAWMATGKVSARADIYYDRIEQIAFERLRSATSGLFTSKIGSDVCMAIILGTVLAHEMGHLLLGVNSHSKDGIMHPRWNRADLEDSYVGRQKFTSKEVKRLHATLRSCDSS